MQWIAIGHVICTTIHELHIELKSTFRSYEPTYPLCISLTMLAVAVCIPVRKKSRPKERAMQKLRWTKL